MDQDDNDKTDFLTHDDLTKYKRMAFPLEISLATFQRAMDAILAMVRWKYAVVHLDDVIVFPQTPSQLFKQGAFSFGVD